MDGVRHIVWDWNGTLLDDVSASVRAMNRMLRRRGLAQLDEVRYRTLFGFPVRGYYDRLGFDLSRESWSAVAREYHDCYEEEAADAPLRDGALAVLEAAAGRGLPMSVLSACETSILRRMLAARRVRDKFVHVCGLSDLFAATKVAIGRELLGRTGHGPGQVLLVGDTVHDFQVARDLGSPCLLVAGGHQDAARLRACGCSVLEGMQDLAGLLSEARPGAPANAACAPSRWW